jgi:hypothetical protein
MREEMEHAMMVLEWIRRNSKDFSGQMDEFLYKKGKISDH